MLRWSVLVLAACSSGSTRVHLEVTADPSWNLDHYQLRIAERSALAEALPALDVELPDAMAGHAQTVQVWGLAEGQQIAYGSVSVTVSLHATVTAAVSLSAVGCGLWCDAGDVVCGDDGTSTTTCMQLSDGCLAWSAETSCPSDLPYCSNGACAAQCTDECTAGQTECDSAFAMRTCETGSDDSCLHWSTPTGCASGQTCAGGACGTTATCASDGDSCDDGNACTTSDTCAGAACSGTPKCTAAPANAEPTCAADGTCGFACHPGFMPQGSVCVPQTMKVFVSSASYTGNLGGLAGADAKCQALAQAAGLPGTYKAWLSDTTTSALYRLTHSTYPYVLVDGTVIANSFATMIWPVTQDVGHLHSIDEDEHGVITSKSVWTNTLTDGSVWQPTAQNTCNNWTSGSSSYAGGFGTSEYAGSNGFAVWTQANLDYCNGPVFGPLGIYCLQQ